MEFASYLAGEKWSDRPPCTHPSLAALARLVNDWTSDAERSKLSPLIPSVIGLTNGDAALELVLAIRAAVHSITVASEERQRLLAVGLIRTFDRLEVVAPERAAQYSPLVGQALAHVPYAEKWARHQIRSVHPGTTRSDTPMCDAVVAVAIAGIGEACVDDRDVRLRAILAEAIAVTVAAQPSRSSRPTTSGIPLTTREHARA